LKTLKLFTSGGSQTLRIPKEYQFTDVMEVHIFREGESVIIKPAKKTWLSLSAAVNPDSDFMLERVDVIEDP